MKNRGFLTFPQRSPQEEARAAALAVTRFAEKLPGSQVKFNVGLALRDMSCETILDREKGKPIHNNDQDIFYADDITEGPRGLTINFSGTTRLHGVIFSAAISTAKTPDALITSEIAIIKDVEIPKPPKLESPEIQALVQKCLAIKQRFPSLPPIAHFSAQPDNLSKKNLEHKNVPRTPQTLADDYKHVAGGIRLHHLEDIILKAYAGEPSPEVSIMVRGIRESLANCSVTDTYGVAEYRDAIEELYDKLLSNMVRGAQSTYRIKF